jgi:hypothetical protein
MCPKTRLLVVQPQVCLANRVCTHFLPSLLIFSIRISNAAVGDSVHNMDTLLAHLARECLCKLAY